MTLSLFEITATGDLTIKRNGINIHVKKGDVVRIDDKNIWFSRESDVFASEIVAPDDSKRPVLDRVVGGVTTLQDEAIFAETEG